MNKKKELMKLKQIDYEEALKIFTLSFSDGPQLPALYDNPELTDSIMRLLFNLYKGSGNTWRCGLKINDRLISVAHCVDATAKPKKIMTLKFALALFRRSGFKIIKQIMIYDKNKPIYDGPNLEIMLYGTLPEYQKQGYGKELMEFIYSEAKKQGYKGVTGITNKSKPAYRFYMKNDWFVDKEFSINNHTLCWVRRLI